MKDQENVLCRIVLELVKKEHVHYTNIERKAYATCLSFATSNAIKKQFYHYLLSNGYMDELAEAGTEPPKREKDYWIF